MAKRMTAEERLSALVKLRAGPVTAETLEVLRSTLADRTTFLVARAAKLAVELNAAVLVPELVAAFNRIMADPGADKGCEAMTAIAEALKVFGADEPELYLRGIRHVQMEAGWGKSVDVAGRLRCECAFGLVRIGYRDVLWHLAGLLADPERECRAAAARAIGGCRADAGMALLKYKVLSSQGPLRALEDEEVVAECFAAMAEVDSARAIPFLAEYLDADDEWLAESAALALGTTRRAEALGPLKARVDRAARADFRQTLLLAIATLRIEAAIEYLVSLIAQSDTRIAAEAIKALALYRRDEAIRGRVGAAVAGRKEPKLEEALKKEFG
jgi:HEAT repeat protein